MGHKNLPGHAGAASLILHGGEGCLQIQGPGILRDLPFHIHIQPQVSQGKIGLRPIVKTILLNEFLCFSQLPVQRQLPGLTEIHIAARCCFHAGIPAPQGILIQSDSLILRAAKDHSP